MTGGERTLVSRVGVPRPRRSASPPAVRVVGEVSLEAIHMRLCTALRLGDSVSVLRMHLAELACDVEDALTPQPDDSPPTLRSTAPAWLEDTAPSTPLGSPLAEEFGPGGSLLEVAK